ncbi:magnesium transporter CorA family protein [Paractinoplanes rishiriensis]|uniref:Magnesium transporter CorA n=1 Tax=Paractinoplanes rishiriensis TaxID=1050105 RepID=A0A919MMI4_9ACTN|nr:magnesium transporter CorA family protein [Actinoplanes rishiriensis]GIE92991.1 magnesium transporter CorA [Actinoplanes rishiriensis]
MAAPACPTHTRLYENGTVVAEDFGADRVGQMLAEHPEAVLWLDLYDPDLDDLAAVAEEFRLHPLALEDAVQDHERPKLDRYPDHLFLNVYAVDVSTHPFGKAEISAFVTDRALITVRKSATDTAHFVERWDADAALAGQGDGVAFLLYGLLDAVVDGHVAAAQKIDVAMDGVEDALLEEGGAPRPMRMRGIQLRKTTAALRRAVAPMPEVVAAAMRKDLGLVNEHLAPYYRDVEDHAQHAFDQVEHLQDRIEGLLQADLAEQSNVLNDITRKLAAWAAIIAVPTLLTGYFGQNVPYPGFNHWSGYVQSVLLIVVTAGGLYLYMKHRRWL